MYDDDERVWHFQTDIPALVDALLLASAEVQRADCDGNINADIPAMVLTDLAALTLEQWDGEEPEMGREKLLATMCGALGYIEEAAVDFSTQVILTTHSPHVIRTASSKVKMAWLADGGVATDDKVIREKMGWGLLDKSILIITEDQNTPLLQAIVDQWPDHSKRTAIWPVFGSENLPTADGARSLKAMLGISKLVVHRDGDFMVSAEKETLRAKFAGSGCSLWITEPSDIEG